METTSANQRLLSLVGDYALWWLVLGHAVLCFLYAGVAGVFVAERGIHNTINGALVVIALAMALQCCAVCAASLGQPPRRELVRWLIAVHALATAVIIGLAARPGNVSEVALIAAASLLPVVTGFVWTATRKQPAEVRRGSLFWIWVCFPFPVVYLAYVVLFACGYWSPEDGFDSDGPIHPALFWLPAALFIGNAAAWTVVQISRDVGAALRGACSPGLRESEQLKAMLINGGTYFAVMLVWAALQAFA